MKKTIIFSFCVFVLVFSVVCACLFGRFAQEKQISYSSFNISEEANLFRAYVDDDGILVVERITSWQGDVIWPNDNEIILSSVWVVNIAASSLEKVDQDGDSQDAQEITAFLSDYSLEKPYIHAEEVSIESNVASPDKEIRLNDTYSGYLVLSHKLTIPVSLTDLVKQDPVSSFLPNLIGISAGIAFVFSVGFGGLFHWLVLTGRFFKSKSG